MERSIPENKPFICTTCRAAYSRKQIFSLCVVITYIINRKGQLVTKSYIKYGERSIPEDKPFIYPTCRAAYSKKKIFLIFGFFDLRKAFLVRCNNTGKIVKAN